MLDFTQVVAGPQCTRMLADLGAEVVKVDRPVDPSKTPVRSNGAAAANLGKRSIALDLKHPDGLAVALELAATADALIESFRPGVMATLGLGFGQLSRGHPRLVYASISGFGQDAQFGRRAYGATAHGEAGLLWVQQQAAATPEPFAPASQWRTSSAA